MNVILLIILSIIQSFRFICYHEGLTNEERVHIRKVLELALRELKDEDILHVLKESLTLRFKVCLSPFPPPPPFAEGITDAYGK